MSGDGSQLLGPRLTAALQRDCNRLETAPQIVEIVLDERLFKE